MAEKLWSKLGVEADAYYLADGHGVAFVLAGLNMRTRDFARFGQLFLNEGVSSGQQIVPSEWVRISVRPTAPAPDYPGDPFGYGYQWWVPPEPDGEFFAVGVYDQYIYVNRPAGVVIVKTAANRKFRDDGAYGNVVQLENITVFRAIVAGVAD
jgi:CubicO group peptidase (beta-lactamase class C family)